MNSSLPRSRSFIRIATLLVAVLALPLASCAAITKMPVTPSSAPTQAMDPTLSPPSMLTSSPPPTETLSPIPTVSPDPRPLLASWEADCLCIGLVAKNEYGADLPGLEGAASDYRLSDGRNVHIEWKAMSCGVTTYQTIRSYRIEGSGTVVATTDPTAIVDEAVLHDGIVVPLFKDLPIEEIMKVFGTPISDVTIGANEHDERTLGYPDTQIVLYQSFSASNKNLWAIAMLETDSPLYETPRGLHTGLAAAKIPPLYSNGDFIIAMGADCSGISSITIFKSTGGMSGYATIISCTGGIATHIDIN